MEGIDSIAYFGCVYFLSMALSLQVQYTMALYRITYCNGFCFNGNLTERVKRRPDLLGFLKVLNRIGVSFNRQYGFFE